MIGTTNQYGTWPSLGGEVSVFLSLWQSLDISDYHHVPATLLPIDVGYNAG